MAPKDLPGAHHTTASEIHVLATIVGGAALLLAMTDVALVERTTARRVFTAVAAAVALTATIVFRFTWGSRYYGAIERAVLLPALTWVSALGVWAMADRR